MKSNFIIRIITVDTVDNTRVWNLQTFPGDKVEDIWLMEILRGEKKGN